MPPPRRHWRIAGSRLAASAIRRRLVVLVERRPGPDRACHTGSARAAARRVVSGRRMPPEAAENGDRCSRSRRTDAASDRRTPRPVQTSNARTPLRRRPDAVSRDDVLVGPNGETRAACANRAACSPPWRTLRFLLTAVHKQVIDHCLDPAVRSLRTVPGPSPAQRRSAHDPRPPAARTIHSQMVEITGAGECTGWASLDEKPFALLRVGATGSPKRASNGACDR
jgi:hypothetical protein